MNKLKFVFLGSGPVAAKSLLKLSNFFDIESVITKPKPKHHKGNMPVIETAKKLGLKLVFTSNKSELTDFFESAQLTSKVAVLIDFGIIVPKQVIDFFPLGIVNSHFSNLPEWRGADPITFAILSGQEKTGVTLMLLNEKLDEGPILAQQQIAIKQDNNIELTDRLIQLSVDMIKDNLPKYYLGQLPQISQAEFCKMNGIEFNPTYSTKISKQDGLIDWHKTSDEILREIRAYAGWPKSYTLFKNDFRVIICDAEPSDLDLPIGQVKIENKRLYVGCSDKAIKINYLQPLGKPVMPANAFLNGYSQKILN